MFTLASVRNKMFISRIKMIDSLPVLPEVVVRIQAFLSQNGGSASDIAVLVEQDQVLSAAVLKVANSALFNYSGKRITNLRDAIVRIGRNELYHVLLGVSVINAFPDSGQIDLHHLWQHSFVSSALVKRLERESAQSFLNSEPIQSAALLHDLGLLVLSVYFGKELSAVIKEMAHTGVDYLTAEQLLYKSVVHADLGSYLLERWRLSPDIYIPVRFHEMPDKAPQSHQQAARLIHLADALQNLVVPFTCSKSYTREQVETLLVLNGIARDALPDLLDFINHENDKALSLLSLWGIGGSMGKLLSTGDTMLLRTV